MLFQPDLKTVCFVFVIGFLAWLQQAEVIRAHERHRQEVLQSLLEVCFPEMQWQYPSLWP